MDQKIADYFRQGARKAISASTQPPNTLFVTFEDGVTKRFEMTDLTGVMSPLTRYSVFSHPVVDDGSCIKWLTSDGIIDIDKDNIYIYGTTVL